MQLRRLQLLLKRYWSVVANAPSGSKGPAYKQGHRAPENQERRVCTKRTSEESGINVSEDFK